MPTFKDGKWVPSEWITEKDCLESDEACGKGLHLMKILNPKYGIYTGNCFEAEGKDLLGEDNDKARFKSIRLIRPVSKDEIFVPYANLRYADLRYADLSDADLSNANLSSANLRYADLSNANLSSANLRYANLRYADLSNANLSNANLRYADLSSADLSSADLSNANLRYADLSNADLSSADLSSARNINNSFNLEESYWNKFTQIDAEFKKLLKKDRFLE